MELIAGAHAAGTASDPVHMWPVGVVRVIGVYPLLALFPPLRGVWGPCVKIRVENGSVSQGVRVYLWVTCACRGPLVGCDGVGASPGCACPPNPLAQRVVGWMVSPERQVPMLTSEPMDGNFFGKQTLQV